MPAAELGEDVSERYHDCPNCGLYTNSLYPHCVSRPPSRSGYDADNESPEVSELSDDLLEGRRDSGRQVKRSTVVRDDDSLLCRRFSQLWEGCGYDADDEDSYVAGEKPACIQGEKTNNPEPVRKSTGGDTDGKFTKIPRGSECC